MSTEPKDHLERGRALRVLSLDGGGMRGLYSASALLNLALACNGHEQPVPLDVGKAFDLIVGTSTGGIIATGLVAGVPLETIIAMYKDDGPRIFASPAPKADRGLLSWAFANRNHAANNSAPLRSSLARLLGQETVGQVYRRRAIAMCVPAVNVAGHKAQVFKTPHLPEKQADNPRTLVEVALATAAAPIVLPLASIPNPDHVSAPETFSDGGLWANNPVLIALTEALMMARPDQPIDIVSVGTCPPPSGEALLPSETNWGLKQWKVGLNALSLSMDAQANGTEAVARLVAAELSKSGRLVRIMRLPQSPPSGDAAQHLALDNATKKSFAILTSLGRNDGMQAYGLSANPANPLAPLRVIFSGLNPLA